MDNENNKITSTVGSIESATPGSGNMVDSGAKDAPGANLDSARKSGVSGGDVLENMNEGKNIAGDVGK